VATGRPRRRAWASTSVAIAVLLVAALVVPATASASGGKTVHVSSIPALKRALANNRVSEIVVRNGTYRVSPAGLKKGNSLWIGKRYASRTRAVTVRAQTRGHVTFDGGGAHYFGGLSFEAGARHQTWVGFNFANGVATDTGVVMFGGYRGLAAPHHIKLRHIRFLSSVRGRATSPSASNTDAAIYIAHAVGGPHHLRLVDINVDGRGYLGSAIQFYHHASGNPNAWNVVIRRLTVTRTQVAIMIWDSTLRNVTVDTARISNAMRFAVSYERPGSGITLRNITSTGSGQKGFSSSHGSHPPGVTFSNNSFH
jgi:hypothetical protein